MRQGLRDAGTLFTRTARAFASDRCPQMAAAIAYNVLFSLLPLVALLVAVFGLVLRVPQIRQEVVDRILESVPLRGGMVVDAVRAVSRASEPLTIAGALALVWAALGLFGTVRDALDIAWGVPLRRPFVRQRLVDLGAMAGLGALIVVSIAGTTTLFAVQSATQVLLGPYAQMFAVVWGFVIWLFPSAITFTMFAMLYRYVPHVDHGFAEVWPGALVATVLFELAKHAFTWYVANLSRYEMLYGALGAVMLFLLWVYVSAVILLIGAETASEWERMVRAREAARRAGRPTGVPPPEFLPGKESHPWPAPSGKEP